MHKNTRNELAHLVMGTMYLSSWVSEASPTLGCSIEILRYIYVCRFVYKTIHMSECVGGITRPKHTHAQSQFWEWTCDTRIIHFYNMLEQLEHGQKISREKS